MGLSRRRPFEVSCLTQPTWRLLLAAVSVRNIIRPSEISDDSTTLMVSPALNSPTFALACRHVTTTINSVRRQDPVKPSYTSEFVTTFSLSPFCLGCCLALLAIVLITCFVTKDLRPPGAGDGKPPGVGVGGKS